MDKQFLLHLFISWIEYRQVWLASTEVRTKQRGEQAWNLTHAKLPLGQFSCWTKPHIGWKCQEISDCALRYRLSCTRLLNGNVQHARATKRKPFLIFIYSLVILISLDTQSILPRNLIPYEKSLRWNCKKIIKRQTSDKLTKYQRYV